MLVVERPVHTTQIEVDGLHDHRFYTLCKAVPNGKPMQDETEQRRLYGRQAPAQRARREALQEAIAQEELALAKLEAQLAESRHRLAALRVDLAALDTDTEVYARRRF
jgi:hypothetical protein